MYQAGRQSAAFWMQQRPWPQAVARKRRYLAEQAVTAIELNDVLYWLGFFDGLPSEGVYHVD